MKHKKQTFILIFDKIIKLCLVLVLLLWSYQIYLTMISYDESFSSPFYIEVIFQTRVHLFFLILNLATIFILSLYKKKLDLKSLKIDIFRFVKNHPHQTIFFSIFFLIIIVIGFIIFLQPIILYHPNHSSYAYDQIIELEIYEEFEVKDDDLTYKGFGAIDKTQALPTIIYFAGNGESSAQSFYQYHHLDFFNHFSEYQFIMIDYPDYGLSEGKTSDEAILQMGDAVYKYVSELYYVDQDNIYIYGYSIGTGVATYIASKYQVEGLILIAPYSSITDLFNTYVPIFKGLLKNLIVEEFDSKTYALNVQVSPLIIASYQDQTVPVELSIDLARYFKHVYDLYLIEDVGHSEFINQEDVIAKMLEYLED
jgi:uncharacterized protein